MKKLFPTLQLIAFALLALGMTVFAQGARAQSTTVPLVYAGQIKIAATNVAQCLPYINAQNGVIVKAKTTNTGNVFVGAGNVNTTDDGTGTGYRLVPGEAGSIAVNAANGLCVAGTQNDVVYYIGN